MIFRLFTVGVFVFCGIMTTWLVRSVYFPEYERLPSVDPAHVLDLFLKNKSPLVIYPSDRTFKHYSLLFYLKKLL